MIDSHSTAFETPVSFFVGRQEFLQAVRETLRAEHQAVITGARGVGKTTLAREYTRLFASEYQQVLWIDVALFSSLLGDTLELAQRFGLPLGEARDLASVTTAIQEWASTQPEMLLVLDNVVLPPNTPQIAERHPISGQVLLIAQDMASLPVGTASQLQAALVKHANLLPPDENEHVGQPATTFLRLPVLPESEGTLLLYQASLYPAGAVLEPVEDERQQRLARELARELQGEPLALTLAGAYLRTTGASLQEYLFAFRDDATEPTNSDDDTFQIILPTCHLLLTYLESAQTVALALLQAIALLAPVAFPHELLQQKSLQAILFPEQGEKQAELLAPALQILLEGGLLKRLGTSLALPPILQAAIRQLVAPERQRQLRESLLRACLELALAPTSQHQSLATFLALAGQIWFLASQERAHIYTTKETGEALAWAASLLAEQNFIQEAEPLLRGALDTWERTLGLSHPIIGGAQLHLAIMNARLKQFAQAETYAQQAIGNAARAPGINHPALLHCLTVLGQIYQQQGKLQNAQLCYEKALSIGERVNLQQHSSFRTAQKMWRALIA